MFMEVGVALNVLVHQVIFGSSFDSEVIFWILSDAPHKNYRKLHCYVAMALSHIEYL